MTADFNRIPYILEQIEQLNRHSISIGASSPIGNHSVAFFNMVINVLNDGATITARAGKYLTIPTPYANGKPVRWYQGQLFLHTVKTGPYKDSLSLAKNDSGQLHIYYYLAKQVVIPARNFIEKSIDLINEKLESIVKKGISDLLVGDIDWLQLMNIVGATSTSILKNTMVEFKDPGNAPITVADKGQDNPLIDTGSLVKSISWEVV